MSKVKEPTDEMSERDLAILTAQNTYQCAKMTETFIQELGPILFRLRPEDRTKVDGTVYYASTVAVWNKALSKRLGDSIAKNGLFKNVFSKGTDGILRQSVCNN